MSDPKAAATPRVTIKPSPAAPPTQGPTPAPNPAADTALLLARMLRLAADALGAGDPAAAWKLIANRVGEVLPVDRCLVVAIAPRIELLAVTGDYALSQDTMLAEAVREVAADGRGDHAPRVIPAAAEQPGPQDALAKVTSRYEGTSLLWLPLWLSEDNAIPPRHALWLERWGGRPWRATDIQLLQKVSIFLGHALARHQDPSARRRSLPAALIVAGALAGVLALPVTSSTLAPAEVVADTPVHVFSSMDGIVQEIAVQPGQRVQAGDLLLKYDTRVIDQRLREAREKVGVAKANLERSVAASHYDSEKRAEVPAIRLEIKRAEQEEQYYSELRRLAEVRATAPGMIILDDPERLIGASVHTGEKLLEIADPSRTKLRVMVPVGDIGLVEKEAEADVRMDHDPLTVRPARVERVGYEVQVSMEQVPSVRVDVRWKDPTTDLLPGQRGSASISGPRTLLLFQLFRKPMIHLRRVFGW